MTVNKYRWPVVMTLLKLRANMSRKDISDATGLSECSITRFGTGGVTPGEGSAKKLIELLESRLPDHLARLSVRPEFECYNGAAETDCNPRLPLDSIACDCELNP